MKALVVQLLAGNPLLLLFLVTAIGYPLGKIKVFGSSLGVAAVLFSGLAMGALDPAIKLPEIVGLMGLCFFVYSLGLSSGPGFFASLRSRGLRDFSLVVITLFFGATLIYIAHMILQLPATTTAGLFSGALTSTPALASAVVFARQHAHDGMGEAAATQVIVAYSLAYPMGVIGMMLAIRLFQAVFRVDYAKEQAGLEGDASGNSLELGTVRVTSNVASKMGLQQWRREHELHVSFGRIIREDRVLIARADERLRPGDIVTVVGRRHEIDRAIHLLGEAADLDLQEDRSVLDYRRVFVSNPRIIGQRIEDLALAEYDAVITRIRRGDLELVPEPDTVLESGDRVRVLCPRENIQQVSKYFGDSYRALSEIDVLTFSVGLALGLLVGLVPIPLPRGLTVNVGVAAGPLLVGLVLGTIQRTGSIVWTLPFSANVMLRQIGVLLFLASVGTRGGYAFFQTLGHGGLQLFLAGSIITFLVASIFLVLCYKLARIPYITTLGMLAGLQTQAALLGFATEQTKSELPNGGYALMYPIAIIVKVVLVQLLLATLH